MAEEKQIQNSPEKEMEELRRQLEEANDTIEAIRTGQVDALVVEKDNSHGVYTLQTADQPYRVFIEKMTEGAVSLNKQGIILYCNAGFASMLGCNISDLLGSSFETLVGSVSLHSYLSLLEVVSGEEFREELTLFSENRMIPVLISCPPGQNDLSEAFSIIITDLSVQKQAQQLLEKNNRQLEDINRALEMSNRDLLQFASVASHDLQEPVRKIQIFSNLLQESAFPSLPGDAKNYLAKIITSAGRMKALITDMLHYSQLSGSDSGFENTDLDIILKEVLEDLELAIKDKNAGIHIGDLAVVYANAGQMRQVFQNLISNALKFSRKGHFPVLHISCKRIATKTFGSEPKADGPYCLISVRDNGIGFDEKYARNIFELFERLNPKDSYEGTGIGLSIAKKIVEKHNGLITAHSEVNKGAEFLIILPIGLPNF